MELLFTLHKGGFAVHRANSRKVKNFIRSYGNGAKTDSLDAKALALYGYERNLLLELFVPQTEKALELYELVQRRNDLKQMLVGEKNRLQAPSVIGIIKASGQLMVRVISEQIALITTGLAPRANDSGKFSGYRSTGHGRSLVKPTLFLAAMAARKSNSPLRIFYENLINRGKKKMVALTALMRKIIVIANAKLRDLYVGNLAIKI